MTGNSTDAEGKWNGLIWTIPTEGGNLHGDYDIIVNFGSPEAPDDSIIYAFTAADVMDGIDGRTEPGFTVYEDRNSFVMLGSNPSASSPGK